MSTRISTTDLLAGVSIDVGGYSRHSAEIELYDEAHGYLEMVRATELRSTDGETRYERVGRYTGGHWRETDTRILMPLMEVLRTAWEVGRTLEVAGTDMAKEKPLEDRA